MDKKWRQTTNLGVEIMNSKRLVKRRLGHVVQIRFSRLTLSIVMIALVTHSLGASGSVTQPKHLQPV